MKLTQTSDMRQGKVAFTIKWEEDFPFELTEAQEKAFNASRKLAFESAKTQLAGKAKKAYALAMKKKPADFSTDDIDDVKEAQKHWMAVCKGTCYSVSGFKDYVPQADGQVSVAKVLAWLQSLPATDGVGTIIEGLDAASLKAAILEAN